MTLLMIGSSVFCDKNVREDSFLEWIVFKYEISLDVHKLKVNNLVNEGI
jgi:hypothetical protein